MKSNSTPSLSVVMADQGTHLQLFAPASLEKVKLTEVSGTLMFSFEDATTGQTVLISITQAALKKLTATLL